MGLFEKKVYVRADSLARASKAVSRGDRKKAIAEYRVVLEHQPNDEMVLTKLGDLLAQSDQPEEAREMLLAAARSFEKRGFDEKALAVHALAVGRMPRDVELVGLLVDRLVARGRNAEGVKKLVETHARLRGRRERAQAIGLLRRVLQIEPGHFEGTLELARLVARDGDSSGARRMLEPLAAAETGKRLRRVRGALFRVSPSPASAWRWLRALPSR